jgi:hypothetical protein
MLLGQSTNTICQTLEMNYRISHLNSNSSKRMDTKFKGEQRKVMLLVGAYSHGITMELLWLQCLLYSKP